MPPKNIVQKSKTIRNKIHVFDYDKDNLQEQEFKNISDCIKYKDTPTVTWINIDNAPRIPFLNKLKLGFNLHPIIIENILDTNQRPKVEILNRYIYVSLRMMSANTVQKTLVTEQVSIVIADKFLLTFQQGVAGDVFEPIRTMLRHSETRIRSLGTDYLCYELMESTVLNYFKVLESFGDQIEDLEEELMDSPSTRTLQSIYTLKREMLELRKAVWPLREIISSMERTENDLINRSAKIYFRDLYERLIHVVDTVETYRDILAGMLDIYLSGINNRISSVMKILAVITTIFMPLTFLTGFFGMNFKFLPGLDSTHAPFTISLCMLGIIIVMLGFFRKRHWL